MSVTDAIRNSVPRNAMTSWQFVVTAIVFASSLTTTLASGQTVGPGWIEVYVSASGNPDVIVVASSLEEPEVLIGPADKKNGVYILPNISPGRYRVVACKAHYRFKPYIIEVASGKAAPVSLHGEIQHNHGDPLTGKVIEKSAKVIDESIKVLLDGMEDSCRIDETVAQRGKYQFASVSPGRYKISACGGKAYRFSPVTVTIIEGKRADIPLIGIPLQSGIGEIRGKIPGQPDMPRENVVLKDLETGCEVDRTASNDNGEYRFTDLPINSAYELIFPQLLGQRPVKVFALLFETQPDRPNCTVKGASALGAEAGSCT